MPFYPAYNVFTMPVTFISDGSSTPLIRLKGIAGDPLKQLATAVDGAANPIWNLANAGGDAVTGDRRSAFAFGDVVNPVFQTMTAIADHVVTNAGAFRLGHGASQNCIIALGNGAPTAANPVSTGMPPDGSFYFRQDGGAGTSIYMARAGAWVAIL